MKLILTSISVLILLTKPKYIYIEKFLSATTANRTSFWTSLTNLISPIVSCKTDACLNKGWKWAMSGLPLNKTNYGFYNDERVNAIAYQKPCVKLYYYPINQYTKMQLYSTPCTDVLPLLICQQKC
jgi:hypothetical protein